MNVPQFTRVLALFILTTAAYYFYIDFDYLVESFRNQAMWNLFLVVTVLWYIYTVRTVIALFKLEQISWYLGNGWLLYALSTRITTFISMTYIYEIDIPGGLGQMVLFVVFYGIAWYFFNKREFKEYFDTELSNRNLSTWLPIAIAGVLLAYAALTAQ